MQSGPPIGTREREVLTAVVETFIATGEPVGSRTLARSNSEGLSPASIRNVMADLSDAGFLEQPHTSAGRIPTTEAYRYYVEQISGRAQISAAEQDKIAGSFTGVGDVQELHDGVRDRCRADGQERDDRDEAAPLAELEHVRVDQRRRGK